MCGGIIMLVLHLSHALYFLFLKNGELCLCKL